MPDQDRCALSTTNPSEPTAHAALARLDVGIALTQDVFRRHEELFQSRRHTSVERASWPFLHASATKKFCTLRVRIWIMSADSSTRWSDSWSMASVKCSATPGQCGSSVQAISLMAYRFQTKSRQNIRRLSWLRVFQIILGAVVLRGCDIGGFGDVWFAKSLCPALKRCSHRSI
jgi:hypothetical protein